ncbi:MAG: starch synthase, partial [Gammaproteobacteria bacterium]
LTQLYSQRYGTVPIVRATGGLIDTVADPLVAGEDATGVLFGPAEPEALAGAVGRAHVLFNSDPGGWQRMMMAGMARDFGWDGAARAYVDLYRQVSYRRTASR